MAYTQLNATVGTTATKVISVPAGLPYTAVTFSNGHTSSIFLGATLAVTTSGATHGITLGAGASIQLWLNANDTVWAIASVASGTGDLTIVYSGV
jgi:hypothetical protein